MTSRFTVSSLAAILAATALGAGCTDPPPTDAAPKIPATTTTVVTPAERRVKQARAATLRIRSTSSCQGIGVGSGFMIAGRRLVTNRHVVSGSSAVNVEAWNGDPVGATISNEGAWADLAVLQLQSDAGNVLPLARTNPKIGTRIYAFGYPGGRQLTITGGQVLGYEENIELGNLGQIMKIDADIEPGSSGGPVVNEAGKVVGVVYGVKLATNEGLAVPITTLRDLMNDPRAVRPVEACDGFFAPG